MKTAINLLKCLLIVLLISNYSCKKDDEEDQCKKTEAVEITIILKAKAKIRDNQNNPVANELVEFRIERNACGANAASDVHTFQKTTDTAGMCETDYVTLTLNNTEDEAFITGTAPNLASSENWKNTTFKYPSFSDGDTTETTLNFKKDLK